MSLFGRGVAGFRQLPAFSLSVEGLGGGVDGEEVTKGFVRRRGIVMCWQGYEVGWMVSECNLMYSLLLNGLSSE